MNRINRTRAIAIGFASIIIIVSILIYSSYTRNVFMSNAKDSIEQTSFDVQTELNSQIKYAFSSIKLISFLSLQLMDGKELHVPEEKLEKLLINSPFDSCQYIRWDGISKIDYPNNIDKTDYSNANFFIDAKNGNTGMKTLLNQQGDDVMYQFYTPLIFRNQFSGVLVGTINGKRRFRKLLQTSLFGRHTDGFIIDKNMTVLSSSLSLLPSGTCLYDRKDEQFISTLLKNLENQNYNSWVYEEFGRDGIACITSLDYADMKCIQIATSKALGASMSALTNSTYILCFTIIISLMALIIICMQIIKKKSAYSETSLKNIIEAISSSFENVYDINLETGLIYIYRMSSMMKNSHGKVLSSEKYDTMIRQYSQNEVLPDDRYLFEPISTIEQTLQILNEQKEYSFIYRIKRENEIHFFECQLIRPEKKSRNFITTFKNMDKIIKTSMDDKQLQNVQEAMNCGRWMVNFDQNSKITEVKWSEKIVSMFGFQSNKAFPDTYDSWTSLIHPLDMEKTKKAFFNILSNNGTQQMLNITYRALTQQNGWKWFKSVGHLSRREDGTPFHFVGLTIDVDKEQRQKQNLIAIAKSYLSMHYIDLVNNIVNEISATPKIKEFVNREIDANTQMKTVMNNTIMPEFLSDALTFTELSTLPERMKGKRFITIDLNGKFNGWVRANFITVETDKEDRPTSVIFTTQIIPEKN